MPNITPLETEMISHIWSEGRSFPVYRKQQNFSLFKYNADGKCIEEKNLKANGRINYKKVTEYDQLGRKRRIITYDSIGDKQAERHYGYDNEGRVILITDRDAHTYEHYEFVFDEWGNEIASRTIKNDSPGITYETKSVYSYDKQNNWTQRIYYINQIPQFVQKRVYTYWK